MVSTSSTDVESFTEHAYRLDEQDPLAGFRDRFVIEDDYIYLDGNSLGRLPIDTPDRVAETVASEWGRRLVLGWDTWLDEGMRIGDRLAPLIGARPGEVAIADQTSINLYKLASGALSASARPNILTDRGNFPSDRYVLGSIAAAAGGRLIVVPEDPTIADLEGSIDASIGLVSLSHVSYRSGTMCNGARVTDLVHDRGAIILWDLAHSAGAVPVDLGGWNADLAVGCTYKYLNGGPGSPGFLYVRKDLQTQIEQPITGWFGHVDQFGFADDWEPATDLRRFLVGTPPIVSMVGVGVGVDLTIEAGIGLIRDKSMALSSLFLEAIEPLEDEGVAVITPRDASHRGSHITVAHGSGYQIASALRDRGVIPDFRAPNLIRFGFTPLYTTFSEVSRAAEITREIVVSRSYESYPAARTGVT
jgi:kynureninase